MKYFLLAWFAILGYTTVMVYEPAQPRRKSEQTAYSHSDVAGMNALIDREMTAKPASAPKPSQHRKVWTVQQEAAAVDALFGRKGIN